MWDGVASAQLALLLLFDNDTHKTSVARAFAPEEHLPVRLREQGVIASASDVHARVKMRTPLPDDDVACTHRLAAVALNAESFGL